MVNRGIVIMHDNAPISDDLLERARKGEAPARSYLLDLYRQRLRHMIDLRLDRRLRARIDPSDVVQEALTDAYRHFDEFFKTQPTPFYPWVRRFAYNRLMDLHRRHMLAEKRSVRREVPQMEVDDSSVVGLADWLIASASSPSGRVMRDEQRDMVQTALLALAERDREILVLRYLEMLSTADTAVVLGISEGAVKVRLFRALERIRALLPVDEGIP
jgi:RNA polymerase sigma-70 factor (ECF subfamily)